MVKLIIEMRIELTRAGLKKANNIILWAIELTPFNCLVRRGVGERKMRGGRWGTKNSFVFAFLDVLVLRKLKAVKASHLFMYFEILTPFLNNMSI